MNDKIQLLTAPIGTTLDRCIDLEKSRFPFATGELSRLLRDIGLAAKIISREINRAGLIGLGGAVGVDNVQGEAQQTLDLVAHVRFVRALREGGQVCAVVSEEEDELIDTGRPDSKYVVAMDPLDGSTNIEVNVPVGTVFSIYSRRSEPGTPPQEADVLQPGRDQVVAGYVLYGSSTMLIYSSGYGVNGFTYDQSLGEFYLSHRNMRFPPEGNIYSVNESHFFDFPPEVQRYLHHCKEQGYTARYIGSLVSDFHRNLLKGGIYLYPSTVSHPSGKLRLLYECNPLAFLAEQAGGLANDGRHRILDIVPQSRHERTPLLIGSGKMVEEAMRFMNRKNRT